MNDLFQILLLVYEAELKGEILNVKNVKFDKNTPFTPKIIGQLSFDAKSNYTIELDKLVGKLTKSAHETMINDIQSNFKLPTDGIYRALLRPEFLNACEIWYSPDYQGGLEYKATLEFENVLGKKVLMTREEMKKMYTKDVLDLKEMQELRKIYKVITGKTYRAARSTDVLEKIALVKVIFDLLNPSAELTNAMAKHWPVIENNPSWMKIFNRLNLHPEMTADIYEGKEENYLKCLGYIGILLDHLDRAEPLPADLYGKCLVLSEL